MSRLRKLVVPFRWNTVAASFTNGTASSVNLAAFLSNPQGRVITYSVIGSLPSGVTLSGSTLSYNGTGAVASTSVQFRATSGTYVAESAATSVAIAAAPPPNTAPTWIGATPSSLGSFTSAGGTVNLSQYTYDAQGDALTYARTGGAADTAPGSVTVHPTTGVLTIPANLAASSYSVAVAVSDGVASTARTFTFSVASATATVLNFEQFEGTFPPAGWVFAGTAAKTAGGYTGSAVRMTCPALVYPADAIPAFGDYSLAALNTRHLYMRFRVKKPLVNGQGGCKFVKVFGKRSGDNYANCTFWMDYSGNGPGGTTGGIHVVQFGDGSTISNDQGGFAGLAPNDKNFGRSNATATITHSSAFLPLDWGTSWHLFELYFKFNSGTSALDEVPDGELELKIDGVTRVRAGNFFNRHWSNGTIDFVRLFDYSRAPNNGSVPAWELWYDNIEITQGGWGTSPV